MVPDSIAEGTDRHVTHVSTSKIGVALHAPSTVAAVLVFSQNVHDKMAASMVLLPTPSPALTVLQTSINTLAAKESLAKGKAPGAVIDRDAALKVLRVALNNERAYVELVVNADPANAALIADAAGMSLRKRPARTKAPLAAKAGVTQGVVHLTALRAPGVKANEWQYSTDAGKTWVDLPSTTRVTTTVTNLTPSTTVHFRHRAVTKNGVSDWSLPVPHVVG
jgi:hypothetical protein